MLMKRLIFLFFALLMAGCGPLDRDPEMVTIRGLVFGTYYTIIYYDDDGRNYQEPIDSLFREFNQSLSFYDKNSLLSRINRNEETEVDDYFAVVFERSQEVAKETDGAFDATVFPLVDTWGFGFSDRSDIAAEKVDSILDFVGHEKVWLDDGHIRKADERVQLDFNAIAKGYAADLVGELLESKGVTSYLVELGGDLAAGAEKPDGSLWRIGLEIPAKAADAPQEWEYYVEISNQGLATSGDYRRYYEDEDGLRYSHTIDPSTGFPVDHHLMSVSVFAPDGMSADAYATAFMVMGLDQAKDFVENREDLEAYFVYATEETEGFGYHASSGLKLMTRDDL